jgi:N-6 DNA Methylase/Type ISP C-terminal specificity domain
MTESFKSYIKAIRETPLAGKTEHTDRDALKALLVAFATQLDRGIKVIAEPPRNKEGYGAPDYRLVIRGATLGYVENKKIDENLNKVIRSEQITKYNELSQNIIVTDYLEWIWLNDMKVVQRARLCDAADIEAAKYELVHGNLRKVSELIEHFLRVVPQRIGTPQEFAKALAKPTQNLKEYVLEDLNQQDKAQESANTLFKVYEDSLKFLSPEMTLSEFADSVAQTLSYSVFIAKLSAPADKVLDLYNVKKYIPQSFHLIRALAGFLDELDDPARYSELRWVLDEILGRINNLDSFALGESLTYKRKAKPGDDNAQRDPYIYFYEPFLNEYDKGQKVDRGVFYTPPKVVKFIVSSINEILKEKFAIADGLADKYQVTLLDFACGTGTFLLEVFRQVLDGLPENSPKRPGRIKDHILEHLYGFEYIVAPYTIAHLKLSQFLKENGYSLQHSDRLKIYLTNTLGKLTKQDHFFINAIHEEGEKAQKIKAEPVLVITGNPPYNNKSKNPSYTEHKEQIKSGKNKGKTRKVRTLTHIGKLLQVYKPSDEKKLNLDDDYIKFIRFAHQKMEPVERGVIGIITNNSFLHGITHRRMPNKLMEDFSEIYILNLHGNSLIGETAPNGGEDKNVFPIRVGVAISIFVRDKKNNAPCRVYYRDLWGKQAEKFDFLDSHTLKDAGFQPIDVAGFDKRFRATRWGKERFKDNLSFFVPPLDAEKLAAYGEWYGLNDIFALFNTGIQTDRDELVIDYQKQELIKRMKLAFSGNYDAEFKKTYNVKNSSSYQRLEERLRDQEFNQEKVTGLNLIVKKVRFSEQEKRLYINADTYYGDVEKDVWEFQIGGYQVLEQYLKSRAERTLTGDEVEQIQNIIRIAAFTLAQIQKIDATWRLLDDSPRRSVS